MPSCPNCGETVEARDRFCVSCGVSLVTEERKPLSVPESSLRRSWKSVLGKVVVVGLAVLGALGLGVGAYEVYEHDVISNIRKTIGNISVQPFDIAKIDAQYQSVALGKNALITDSPLQGEEDSSSISILPSVDLKNAGRIELLRKSTSGIPMNLVYYMWESGVSFGITTYEGMSTDTVEIYRLSNYDLVEKFSLGDNRYRLLCIGGNLGLTDVVKDAPGIDSSNQEHGGWINEILTTNGQKFDTTDKSILFYSMKGDQEKGFVVINSFYQDGTKGRWEAIIPAVQDGNLLFSSPPVPIDER